MHIEMHIIQSVGINEKVILTFYSIASWQNLFFARIRVVCILCELYFHGWKARACAVMRERTCACVVHSMCTRARVCVCNIYIYITRYNTTFVEFYNVTSIVEHLSFLSARCLSTSPPLSQFFRFYNHEKFESPTGRNLLLVTFSRIYNSGPMPT